MILYGHQRGLSLLWRGGKRRKDPGLDTTSLTSSHAKDSDVIVVDGDDERPTGDAQAETDDQYEAAEEEQDTDHPFPNIICDVEYQSDAEILRMSTPTFSMLAESEIPDVAKSHMLVTVAMSNGKVLLLLIPLGLPGPSSIQKLSLDELDQFELAGDDAIAHDISMKVFKHDIKRSSSTRDKAKPSRPGDGGQLLIAAVASGLNLWSLNLQWDSISELGREVLPIVHSTASGHSVSFQPSPRSGQLALANRTGVVRIYDVFATRSANDSTTQVLNPATTPIKQDRHGRFITSFASPFRTNTANPTLALRKKILASAWVLHGRGLLVLLEDGEWGIWDLSPPANTGNSFEDFTLRGYIDSSSAADIAASAKPKKTGSKLAPMTPNTRKVKAENLFAGQTKLPGVAATGGVSVSPSSDRSGKADESLIIWYNRDVYSIPSMQAFWQRSTSSSGGLGSLHAPGLTHISDVNLMNELITSISQFSSKNTASNLGQMNTQKDLLVSAEHRLVILQQLRSTGPSKRLFQQVLAERPATRDQQMLDVGELAVDGLDRMLDNMAENTRPRRVGFAT